MVTNTRHGAVEICTTPSIIVVRPFLARSTFCLNPSAGANEFAGPVQTNLATHLFLPSTLTTRLLSHHWTNYSTYCGRLMANTRPRKNNAERHILKMSMSSNLLRNKLLLWCVLRNACLQAEQATAIRKRKFLNKFSVIINALCQTFFVNAKKELESCCTDV